MSGKNSEQSTVNSGQWTHRAPRWLVPAAILALSLVALQAILRPSLPCSDDAAFHLLRLTQLDHLLRQGVVYSRWAPDMAQGYGFPFFNFYAPLSYYLAEAVSLLAGNLNLGLRLTFALSVYLAGLTAYRLSRDHFSTPAALVTAVAYMFAPYFAYDILFRGNLAESVAWLFLPLSLWTMGRLARTGQTRWLAAAALSYAAVLLTHNVFALIFSPLLGLYGLVESSPLPNPLPEGASPLSLWERVRERVSLVFLVLLLGLGLSAFFWLPAMMERSLVHSDRLLVPPIFVYWGNFVTLAEIFTLPQTVYVNLINPSPARALGLIPLLLALPALLVGWRRFQNGRRRQVLFFGVATAVYVFLMTAVSEPIWANLPLIEYVQFPWRLLGPAALCLAILIGASVDTLTPHVSRFTLFIVSFYCIVLILGSLYWLDARYCPGLENPTIADMQEFERASLTIGTTAKGEYLPLTVEYMPEQPAVEPFAKLPETVTSTGSVTVSGNRTPKQFTASISATEPFTLTANTFTYPGWQAELNGQKVDITPSEGTGLITIPVPAGDHDLTITFRETPLRLLANLVSLLSLGVLVLVASGRWQVAEWQSGKFTSTPHHLHTPSPPHLFLIGLALFVLVGWVLPKLETPLRRSTIPAAEAAVVYQNNLTLLNYTIAAREMAGDGSLLVQSNWQAPQPITGDFRETVRLIGPDGLLWSEKTAVSPRWYRQPTPTTAWTPEQFADSQLLIEPIPGTPPGLYTIQLLLFDEETLAPVPLVGGQTTYDLGSVQVTRPQETAVLEPQYALSQSWDGVLLSGVSLDREAAAPGDPFLLTLYWQVDETPADDASVQLSLVDEAGIVVFSKALPPVRADFPTSQWQTGDVWLGQHAFRLPVALDSGDYQWTLQWCVADVCEGETAVSTGSTAVLGNLALTAPERLFTPPALDIETNAQFSEWITLLGVNIASQPENLQTTLVWQTAAEIPIS
ncbi:MAG: glycosyltransferase family 39 protein, partial [Chloroflexota bacterium]